MISSLYMGNVVKIAAYKFSPDKLILLVDEPIDETRSASLKSLKNQYKDLVDVEIVKSPVYDVVEIAKIVAGLIDKNSDSYDEIILHISEARKTYAIGMLYGGYARSDKIKRIVYLTKEDAKIIDLPILRYSLGDTKRQILLEMKKEGQSARTLSRKLNLHRSMIYVHLKQLEKMGYISKDYKITDSGRLSII